MEKNTSKKPFGFSKLIVYICLILLAITIIVPVAWVFLASVKQNKEFYGNPWTLPEKLYFQNFVDAWTKADMGSYILNSVIVTALAIAMLIAVALPAAYVLSRFKFRTCKFWNLLFMAGLFINVSYIVVPIFLMLNNWDKSLRQMIGRGFFLNNLFILAVVYMATALPFTIYLLSGYFSGLAKDFEEAAYVDGIKNRAQEIIYITVPSMKPQMLFGAVMSIVNAFNMGWIGVTLAGANPTPDYAGQLIANHIDDYAYVRYEMGYASAVSVALLCLVWICSKVANKLFTEKDEY